MKKQNFIFGLLLTNLFLAGYLVYNLNSTNKQMVDVKANKNIATEISNHNTLAAQAILPTLTQYCAILTYANNLDNKIALVLSEYKERIKTIENDNKPGIYSYWYLGKDKKEAEKRFNALQKEFPNNLAYTDEKNYHFIFVNKFNDNPAAIQYTENLKKNFKPTYGGTWQTKSFLLNHKKISSNDTQLINALPVAIPGVVISSCKN